VKTQIQHRARELGFDTCRFTTALPAETGGRFEHWLAAQQHGEMAYLQRTSQKRLDPQRVLQDAHSIISLAVSYHEPVSGSEFRVSSSSRSEAATQNSKLETRNGELPRGIVARYARFTDYHEIIGERLKLLTEFVNHLGAGATRSLWYVDTGPMLERDLAQRAGLGFIGKHTNVISRTLGNWIFLAEIITTLELAADAPERNRCGCCTRCITACPTQAITAPFQLDARRCISYLTIELRGPIPVPLRSAIGERIFGCDDCLAVCPWNRFAQEGQMMKTHARRELGRPDLIDLLALDEATFKRRFAGTPLLRAKRRGLLRNVCVALGNVGDKTALPALQRACADPEPLIAEHASWAVAQITRRAAENKAA